MPLFTTTQHNNKRKIFAYFKEVGETDVIGYTIFKINLIWVGFTKLKYSLITYLGCVRDYK
jgi:hypothetical protein